MVSKSTWAVITIGIALVSVYLTIQTIQASTDYWLQKSPEFFPQGDHTIIIYCKNGGGEVDADFNLVVTFVNASFSDKTEKSYYLVNDSKVEFGFILHKGESGSKTVYFSFNDTTTEFSISVSLEKKNFFDMLKANPLYPTTLQYNWNDITKSYTLIE
jgi:hypothetical protein